MLVGLSDANLTIDFSCVHVRVMQELYVHVFNLSGVNLTPDPNPSQLLLARCSVSELSN